MNNDKPFRILCLGGSNMLPRKSIALRYEDTYIGLIEASYYRCQIWPFLQGGRTVTEMNEWLHNYASYLGENFFDASIILMGLVGCAPRPLSTKQRRVVSKLPGVVQAPIIKFLHNNRAFIQKNIGYHQSIKLDDFKAGYKAILNDLAHVSRLIICMPILPITDEEERHSPFLRKERNIFNDALLEVSLTESKARYASGVAETLISNPKLYLTNDIHTTKEGHREIWRIIKPMLDLMSQ